MMIMVNIITANMGVGSRGAEGAAAAPKTRLGYSPYTSICDRKEDLLCFLSVYHHTY